MLVILLIVELALAFGPIGRLMAPSGISLNLFVITLWLLAWFTEPRPTYTWVLLAGLALDALSFRYFGFYTAGLLLITYILFQLRSRLLDVSSGLHTFAALLIAVVLAGALEALLGGFRWVQFGLGIVINLVVGIVLYYLLAIRLRLFSRWAGKRLG